MKNFYVSVHNFRLRRCMSTIFYSTYSPMSVDYFSYPSCGTRMSQNFFAAIEVEQLPQKQLFSLIFGQKSHCNITSRWVWNHPNHHDLTFWTLEINWNVVRPSWLLLRVDMDLTNIPDIIVVVWKSIENNWECFWNDVLDLESTTFGSETHGSLSFYLSKILKMDVNP